MTEPPKKLLILSDGTPGHVRQSQAVAAAVAKLSATELSQLEVRARPGIPRGYLPRLTNHPPARWYLELIYGLQAERIAAFDLVISTNRRTLGPNILLKEMRGRRNVYIGALQKGIDPRRVDVIFVTRPSLSNKPHHVLLPIGPAPLDLDTLSPARPWESGMTDRTVALLVGGASADGVFSAKDWPFLAKLVSGLVLEGGNRVVVVSSRRTPLEAEVVFAAVRALPAEVARLIDYRAKGLGSIRDAYAADALLVTADSVAMTYEAIATGRPTIMLTLATMNPRPDDENFSLLIRQNRLGTCPIQAATPALIDQMLCKIQPFQENILTLIGRILHQRLEW